MSEIPEFLDQNDPSLESGGEMTIFETWIAAVTKPNVGTFADIAAQPGATTGKAFLWVFVAALISGFANLLAQSFSVGSQMGGLQDLLPPEIAREIPMSVPSSIGFGTVICGAPVFAIMGVIGFAISVALIQWVAKLFGGAGSFDKLAYTFSAIFVPVSVVSALLSLLGAIPFVGVCFGVLSFAVSIYMIVLQVFAVQAVNGLDTGKAVGSVLLPGLVFFLFICCCVAIVVGGLTAMGPAIGDIFNELNQGLY
ncbi:MAG: YIP1 family protein [Anaerolineae bacterium]|jgi:hypothetical protein|nr:YIP1 family protein [Anaerolineae bacterium]MBT7991692.1 YIP1 family protein [Anaerolineae bacterium]